MNEKEYQFGTPSLQEWSGPWKSKPSDSDVSCREYDGAWASSASWLSLLGDGAHFIKVEPGLLGVGRPHLDRTLVLEVLDPNVLTLRLISHVQTWLRLPGFELWRILIRASVIDTEAIVVYPTTVRVSKASETDLAEVVEMLKTQILARLSRWSLRSFHASFTDVNPN